MSVRTDLFSRITAVSGITDLLGTSPTRFYWQQLPQGVTYPACRYFVVSDDEAHAHDGPAGHEIVRVQIDIFDTSDSGCESVAAAVRAGLNGVRSGNLKGMKKVNETDAFEEADDQWRIGQEYLVHHTVS